MEDSISMPRDQETESAEETVLEMAPEQLGVESNESAAEQETDHIRALVEAIVYVLEEPMSAAQIAQVLNRPKEQVQEALNALVAESAKPHRGLAVREVAGGFKMSTKPEFHDDVRSFVKRLKPPLKLSLAALETLAVVAYKQPITAPEIQEIRGVQGTGVLKTLLERKLINAAGRKQVVGRPVLYKTTKDFLLQFGLKDLAELPTLKEFEEWSRLALGDAEDEVPPVIAAAAAASGGEGEPDESLPEAGDEVEVGPSGSDTVGEEPAAGEEAESAEGDGKLDAVAEGSDDADDEPQGDGGDDDESDDDELDDDESDDGDDDESDDDDDDDDESDDGDDDESDDDDDDDDDDESDDGDDGESDDGDDDEPLSADDGDDGEPPNA